MEATLLSGGNSALSSLSLSKSMNSHTNPLTARYHRSLCPSRPSQLAHLQLRRLGSSVSWFGSGSLVRGLGSIDMGRTNLQYAPSFVVSFAYGGGGFGGRNTGGGGGGGGEGSTESGDLKPRAVASGAGDASVLSSDVIILDVTGMTCGGCAASVKRILESQPQVSTANVNLTTETAIVWPLSEVMVAPNWKKDVGEALAKHLTTCGFKSNLRDQGDIEKNIQS